MRCPKRDEKRGEIPNEAARVSQHMQGRDAGSCTTTPRFMRWTTSQPLSILTKVLILSCWIEECKHVRINFFGQASVRS